MSNDGKRYRGKFQGWIGDYACFNENGVTLGYHQSNKGGEQAPDYVGTEDGLYEFAGAKRYVRGVF
ncbi:hypothetical protein [Rhizobium phage RHph_X2_26]|nr:hypothetical protein [Rhizobium phage RHph_X2_26]